MFSVGIKGNHVTAIIIINSAARDLSLTVYIVEDNNYVRGNCGAAL
jgi:hypothetical protein